MSASRGGAACGIWVATEATDIILVEKAASVAHQDHIIAHELGHMAFDHYGTLAMSASQLGELLPNLAPALVRRVLGRNAYKAREEQEAEVFASVVMSRLAWEGRAGATGDGPEDGEVNRFASALEPDGMWRD